MSENKTRHEILEEVYHNANNQLFFVPMKLGVIAMQAYADQEVRKAIAWVLNNTDGRTALDIDRPVSDYINSL